MGLPPHLGRPTPGLPALYTAMDSVSIRVQRRYLFLLAGDLVILLIAALVSSFAVGQHWRQAAHIATGLLFAVSIVLSLVLALKSYERSWYRARAGAESIKTLAWRYMTCAPPYPADLVGRDVDERFTADLRRVLDESEDVPLAPAANASRGVQITASMREVRGSDLEQRKSAYLVHRVGDQQRWYGDKAGKSDTSGGRWFFAMIAAQSSALMTAIVQVAKPNLQLDVNAALAAVAAACMAWLQAKRFQELAQSYAVAAHELGLIAVQGPHIRTDEDLAKFVASAEDAISREHTLWIVKRDRSIGER